MFTRRCSDRITQVSIDLAKEQTKMVPKRPDPADHFTLEAYRRDPRKAITEDGVICLVCGVSFRHLTNTHLRSHGVTSAQYKKHFGYNLRRALMIPTSRQTHSENATNAGLASRIRQRRIFEDLDLKRQGGR